MPNFPQDTRLLSKATGVANRTWHNFLANMTRDISSLSSELEALVIFQPGMLMPYAGTTAPSEWLLCYGQAISRTTYADLFTAISTTYGIGDGTTTFNLPDLRGRVIAGQDDMGGVSANRLTGVTGSVDGDVLGGTGGEETHTLLTAEMPAHTHTVSTDATALSSAGTGGVDAVTGASSTTTGSTGGDGAHNNVPPCIILNYIIFSGV